MLTEKVIGFIHQTRNFWIKDERDNKNVLIEINKKSRASLVPKDCSLTL